LTGNHEESARLRYHRDVTYDILKELDLLELNMGYDGFLWLDFAYCNSRAVFKFYLSHGFGASRKSGAKVNRLEDVAHSFGANIIIMAHEHKKVIAPTLITLDLDDRGKLINRFQHACMSGSFLRGYVQNATTYVEKAGYPPSDLGTICISIKPWTREINIKQ
jgi:hypothetical protein